MSYPLLYEWTGDAFKVLPRFAAEADKRFTVHERYRLDELQDRSTKSHNHYFAALEQAWLSLPEGIAERFPTVEHLRKYALIKCGFYDEKSIVAASKAEAARIAAFIRPMNDFAIVLVMEATVVVYTAKSQSKKAMGAPLFQQSKSKVLELVASMVGTTPARVNKAAENV